ncbi:MAG TPA: rod shape-determining protein MreD [Actinomycetota bacterium]|nr:rod shape-determining protein MreD [Actinomycetota bacterium]
MRRSLAWTAVVVTALLLQSTAFAQIKLLGAKPELMYLLTVVIAMLEGPASGTISGFAAGMGQDFLLHQPKGITALTLTLLGYVVGMIRQYIVTPSPALPVVLVAAATFVGVLFYGLLSFLLGQLTVGFLFLLRTAFLSAIYNAVLTPILYPVIRRVAEASRPKKVFRW